MATAALLGKSLAPRIARTHEQTLYKLDRSRHYAHLDPILDGTVKPHLVHLETGVAVLTHMLGQTAREGFHRWYDLRWKVVQIEHSGPSPARSCLVHERAFS